MINSSLLLTRPLQELSLTRFIKTIPISIDPPDFAKKLKPDQYFTRVNPEYLTKPIDRSQPIKAISLHPLGITYHAGSNLIGLSRNRIPISVRKGIEMEERSTLEGTNQLLRFTSQNKIKRIWTDYSDNNKTISVLTKHGIDPQCCIRLCSNTDDVFHAREAHLWTIAFSATSHHMGLEIKQLESLTVDEINKINDDSRAKFFEAGTFIVCHGIWSVIEAIKYIDFLSRRGFHPKQF